MRLRHIPEAASELAAHPEWVVQDVTGHKGSIQQLFEKEQDLHLEIGTGKGQFIIDMAKAYPEYNFIGMEMQTSVIYRALERLLEEEVDNVRLMNANADDLEEIFEEGEVDHLYLNFSDPWPKNRHAKRRLTHRNFLKKYQHVLKDDACLDFKTDNRSLFEFSLMEFSAYQMDLLDLSLDLHADESRFNIQTEYEERFSSQGQVIYYAQASFN